MPIVKQTAKELTLLQNFKGVKIINSKLKDDSAILGGIVIARENSLI